MTFFRQLRFGALTLLFLASLAGSGCGGMSGRDARDERDPLLRRARERRNAKDMDGAIEYYQRALDNKPGMARAHLELASIYDQSKNDYVRAIYHYERYLELQPQAEKKELVQDLIRHAKLGFATSLPDRSNESVREIVLLKQEINALKDELDRLRGVSSPAPRATTQAPVAVAQPAVVTPTAPPSTAPAVVIEPYVVVSGDTLSRIAGKVYGDSKRAQEIFEANRSILPSQNSLKVGQTLQIPKKSR